MGQAREQPGGGAAADATAPDADAPVALVLGGGGARAAYQVGLLRYIGRRAPGLRFPILTGVSAGAINVGFLGAHPGDLGASAEALRRRWCSLTTEEVFRSDPLAVGWRALRWLAALASGGARVAPHVRGLVDTSPLRAFLTRSMDPEGIRENLAVGRHRAVALSALSYQTGRTVTFVQGDVSLAKADRSMHHRAIRTRIGVDHVMASAAIPLLFPAVKVGQQWYGDGSFRHTAPLAPAIHLGAGKILAVSARYRQSPAEVRRPEIMGYPPPARILGLLLNSVFLDTMDWDAARLRRVNDLLERLPEEERRAVPLRHVDLLILRPSRDIGRLAADFEGRLPRTLRFMVRGLGTTTTRSGDFVSYMLFESAYIARLIELGERDAEANWPRIAAFFGLDETAGAAVAARAGTDDGCEEEEASTEGEAAARVAGEG